MGPLGSLSLSLSPVAQQAMAAAAAAAAAVSGGSVTADSVIGSLSAASVMGDATNPPELQVCVTCVTCVTCELTRVPTTTQGACGMP
jgi:hypothetical protein